MEHAPVQPDMSLDSVMFDLILRFLQTPGQVLLVQGPPGSGKTTFALEILNSLGETHKIYASSRVAPSRLRQHFPWIDEVIDTMSGRTARASWIDELHDLRRVEPDTIFNQVLRLKHSKQRAVLVVDSWEGAIRNTNGLSIIRNRCSLSLTQMEAFLSAAGTWTCCLAARPQEGPSCWSTLTVASHP